MGKSGEKLPEKVYCRRCGQKTNHLILTDHSIYSEDDNYEWSDSFYVVQCLGCDTLSFVREEWNEGMQQPNGDGEWNYFSMLHVYPEPPMPISRGSKTINEFYNVPEFLSGLYSQVVNSFNSQSFILCAIGLRSIIEGICKHLKVTEGYALDSSGNKRVNKQGNEIRSKTLEGKINGLVEQGLIVKKQAEVLHEIRHLGNYAVHEVDAPTKKTLRFAIDIIEIVFTNIFDLDNYKAKINKGLASK